MVVAGSLLLVAGWSPPGNADCARDLHGEVICSAGGCARDQKGRVLCSRFDDGGAALTRTGRILCGPGICQKTFTGEIYCSSVPGGDAIKDSRGRVRCEGSCVPGNAAYCEGVIADSAD